jgi:hypothetical protein
MILPVELNYPSQDDEVEIQRSVPSIVSGYCLRVKREVRKQTVYKSFLVLSQWDTPPSSSTLLLDGAFVDLPLCDSYAAFQMAQE